MKRLRARAVAVWLGLVDGFQQPHEVGSSWNLDHLLDVLPDAYNVHDGALSVGQFVRAGFGSEAWRERLWPFDRVRRR